MNGNGLGQDDQIKLNKNYKHYQDKLLQISKRNRSVLLKRIYNKHNFDLKDLDSLKEGVADRVLLKAIKNINLALNDRVDEGKSQNILLDSIVDEDADIMRGKLKSLKRSLALIEEETGQQTGYLGFPFLEGHIDPDFYVRGPIVLFPISLEYSRKARNGGWFLRLEDKRPILNGALIVALKKRGGYDLPEDYEDTFDDMIERVAEFECSIDEFFDRVNEWIKTLIPIDETLNVPKNVKIDTLNKDKLSSLEIQKHHLANYAIIGNFPQADNQIYKDYNKLIKGSDPSKIVANLLDMISDTDVDDDTHEDIHNKYDINGNDIQLNLALPSDSSQDQVILESKSSGLVVVRGPPGTGKSQVIVNLITDALTNDKRVAVICQKRAALEVVKQRLGQIGLDEYIVLLGKESDDRKIMYSQLHDIIVRVPEPISGSEKTIEEISRDIDSCVEYLVNIGSALKREYKGATAHKIYSKADGKYTSVLSIPSDLDLEWKDLDRYIQDIVEIEEPFKKFEDQDHPWFGRKSFAEIGILEKNDMNKNLEYILDIIPKCIIAKSLDQQIRLESLFDTYLNNPGFLKLKRRSARKEIEEILKYTITEQFVTESFHKIKEGIKFWNTFERLLETFNDKKSYMLRSLSSTDSLIPTLNNMRDTLDQFNAMQEFDKKKTRYKKSLLDILYQAKTRMSIDSDWAKNIRQEIYVHWLAHIEEENPILKGEPRDNYELQRLKLAELMNKKQEIVIKTIQRKIEGTVSQREIQGWRTVANQNLRDFMKELTRKRKVKPVRKLFEEYPKQMLRIAPCWLMSPEMVSKVFPLERDLFDLVIVDEASQLAVERSIPFLHRAKRIVIAGDEKQLSPFDLFQIREDEDEEDEDIIIEPSLLELARTRYNTTNLSWHYRSKYQELIDFSNHAFYNGLLNVAPNVSRDREQPPIRWIKSNGMWENRRNIVEADRVVQEIRDILKNSYARGEEYPSIGVITFGDEQRDVIDDKVEKLQYQDPEFAELYNTAYANAKRDDRLFVRNIENVQGDERDVIIFSIGYARDADGYFANRFGSLSVKGGENRLNVAITRARKSMIIVSSIEPGDIKETSKNDGPRLLRKFLEYAKTVDIRDTKGKERVLGEIIPDMSREKREERAFDSEFEIQVYKKLIERGYEVDTQIGSSGYRIDLGIVHPNDSSRYILGIECDGATFHSTKSVKERDVMRQRFLENKGWYIERVWSSNWWRDSEREIDRIESVINNLI